MSNSISNSVAQNEGAWHININQGASVKMSDRGPDESHISVSVANDDGEVTATGRGDSVSVELSSDEPPAIEFDDEDILPTNNAESAGAENHHGGWWRADRNDDSEDAPWHRPDEQHDESPGDDVGEPDFADFGPGHMTQSVFVSNVLDLFFS